jgi:hypothetical protein
LETRIAFASKTSNIIKIDLGIQEKMDFEFGVKKYPLIATNVYM